MQRRKKKNRRTVRTALRTVKRLFKRKDAKPVPRRSKRKQSLLRECIFNPLKAAQDIVDHNRTIVLYGAQIGVRHSNGTEIIYSVPESKLIMKEFHEMFDIAKRCTHMCDPLRAKLRELLFVCQPIGLSDARAKESNS